MAPHIFLPPRAVGAAGHTAIPGQDRTASTTAPTTNAEVVAARAELVSFNRGDAAFCCSGTTFGIVADKVTTLFGSIVGICAEQFITVSILLLHMHRTVERN